MVQRAPPTLVQPVGELKEQSGSVGKRIQESEADKQEFGEIT